MRQIEQKYINNGLQDFKLKTKADMLKIFDIDITKLPQYETLTDTQKEFFETFICNLFNAHGLDAREDIKPISFYDCIELETIAPNPEDNNYFECIELRIYNATSNELMHQLKPKTHTCDLSKKEKIERRYYRFEYLEDAERNFLHVKTVKSWY